MYGLDNISVSLNLDYVVMLLIEKFCYIICGCMVKFMWKLSCSLLLIG